MNLKKIKLYFMKNFNKSILKHLIEILRTFTSLMKNFIIGIHHSNCDLLRLGSLICITRGLKFSNKVFSFCESEPSSSAEDIKQEAPYFQSLDHSKEANFLPRT